MPIDRREWLRRTLAGLGALGAGVVGGALGPVGCGGEEPPPAETEPASVVRVPVSSIPEGGRLETEHAGVLFELRRQGDTVQAISLLCSHQMCHLEWRADDRRYFCPCHEGLFAEDGTVVYGPPKRPLRRLDFVVEDGQVVLDVNQVYRRRTDAR